MAEPEYRHEEIAPVPRGYHVRTILRGKHQIRVAYPPGRRVTGSGQPVSILHPLGENPHCHVRNIFLNNPTTLERKRAARERAKRIREARLGKNPVRMQISHDPAIKKFLARMYDPKFGNLYATGYTKKQAAAALRDVWRKARETGSWRNPIDARDRHCASGADMRQLTQLWHTARIAGATSRHERLAWASREWEKTHPGQRLAAYKALDRSTRGYGNPDHRTYEAAGKSFPSRAKAEKYAKEIERSSGIRVPVYETTGASNPDSDELGQAERLYEEFHGRAPREILEIQEQAEKRGDFTSLGDLVELSIIAPNREHVQIKFKGDGVRLASSPEANQLWFIGGNQDLSRNLWMFGVKDRGKDLLDLGEAKQVVYEAAKWQTDFTPQEWKHDLGEKSGVRPRLFYDQQDLNHPKMFLAGGTYKVRHPGIID